MQKPKTSLFILGVFTLFSASVIATACDKQNAPAHKTAAAMPANAVVGVGQFAASAAYVRAVPPGQTLSAAFMQLQNNDSQAHALVKAESSVATVVELHNHVNEGGVMKMRKVEKIDLPAGKTVALKPGSFHIMLIGLKQPLKVGETVDLSLSFEDGTSLKVSAPVQEVSAPMH
ncbi:copper chaperone PCu(A)C [uncultured Thiothrix sp.]|uniref:copper chaperone PCu(A)C n=1 Tax=uncultured Thiothrix sp. TaxID=223185 RepID=UPI002631C583|nr:copper chaperone PCu(A)C [uncultured Thiothrix sp.]HMT93274.1 copper chaperone PCu(A)C [Thiolinea sp.]